MCITARHQLKDPIGRHWNCQPGSMHMTIARSGFCATRAEARLDGGVRGERLNALSVLTNPKHAPNTMPVLSPRKIVPTTTGMHSIVTLIKPRGINPRGVSPNSRISATNSAVTTRLASVVVLHFSFLRSSSFAIPYEYGAQSDLFGSKDTDDVIIAHLPTPANLIL